MLTKLHLKSKDNYYLPSNIHFQVSSSLEFEIHCIYENAVTLTLRSHKPLQLNVSIQ